MKTGYSISYFEIWTHSSTVVAAQRKGRSRVLHFSEWLSWQALLASCHLPTGRKPFQSCHTKYRNIKIKKKAIGMSRQEDHINVCNHHLPLTGKKYRAIFSSEGSDIWKLLGHTASSEASPRKVILVKD